MIPNAGSSSYATNAVDDLQNIQSGLGATHDGEPSHNTVLGPSYGTTTVGYAARDGNGLAARDLIFVGSPGVGVEPRARPAPSGRRVAGSARRRRFCSESSGWAGSGLPSRNQDRTGCR
jgi:hypothetical protein